MTQNSRPNAQDEKALMTELWDSAISENPYNFAMFAFPWGKPNTPLHHFKRPRTWQCDEFLKVADHIKQNKERMNMGLPPVVYKSAICSGRGPGKSAFLAIMDLWMMTCVLGSSTIITANTEDQLKSKTLAELGKWHTLSINNHWFDKNALSLKPAPWFEAALKQQLKIDTGYYYALAQLWSEEKPDSFAGTHNMNGIMVQYDEASGIPKPIWTVTEGFFTEPVLHRYWFVFSNGRRNTGPFFECFHKDRKFWNRRSIDSRTVEGTDIAVYNEIIEKHGDDSDEARIEVKGQFPRQGDKQFIPRDLVIAAREREVEPDQWAPLIMGVDPARFGSDDTVIRFRQGRDARSIRPVKMKGRDNMAVANECARLIDEYNPDAVCIDAGNGTGIIDRLRELKYVVHEVWFGSSPPKDKKEWADFRTYIWAEMRDWLGGAMIDLDDDLETDLTAPEYKFVQTDRIKLESKEDMKSRGFDSPDDGDALACTFAVKVPRRDRNTSRHRIQRARHTMAKDLDYSVFG